MFIAIIFKQVSGGLLKREAVTAAKREDVIARALAKRDEWQQRGHGPYRIFIGELTTEIVIPKPQYEERPIIGPDVATAVEEGVKRG